MLPEPVAPQERDWQAIDPLLDQELNRLPAAYRAAVICCDLEGHSRIDAARQLGWPEGTLKVRLMRAHSILAKRLTRQGVALSVGTLAVVLSEKAASAAVPAALVSSTAKAAGALAATKGASTSVGVKVAALAKGSFQSLYAGKIAVAAVAGGVTLTAALALTPPKKPAEPPQPPPQFTASGLPAVVERALQENARQLSPITVTCTAQLSSRLPPTETFDRLKLNPFSRSDRFFSAIHGRILWQDNKVYSIVTSPVGSAGDKESTMQSDILYDGDSRVVLRGSSHISSKEFLDQQKKNGVNMAPVIRNLTKEPMEALAQKRTAGHIAADMAYFQTTMGLVLAMNYGKSPAGGQDHLTLSAGSAVLAGLSGGWKLVSVENTQLEGRSLVRIDLEGENTIRAAPWRSTSMPFGNVSSNSEKVSRSSCRG